MMMRLLVCGFLALAVALPLSGFRPAGTMSTQALESLEDSRTSRGDLEYLTMVTVGADGAVREHRVLRIIRKTAEERFTHLRLLAPGEDAGYALLTRQRVGEYARVWEARPGAAVREVAGADLAQSFADSVWTYGDSLLDWVPASRVEVGRPTLFRGQLVNVIDCYPFPELAGLASGYSFRRYFLDRENSTLLCVEHYDEAGKLIKFLDFLDYREVMSGGEAVLTPARLQMTHLRRNETATLVYLEARYDQALDASIFERSTFASWSPEQDTEMLRLLNLSD